MFARIHALRVRSDRVLPGLVPGSPFASHDLDIAFNGVPPADLIGEPSSETLWFNSQYVDEHGRPTLIATWLNQRRACRLAYTNGPTFVIDRDATRIWPSWPESLSFELVAWYLLGPIMGVVLRLRGITSLHASAIAIDGKAALFVGPSGAGKSSTAAAFAASGGRVLADDTVALRRILSGWMASPAYPRLRLWPDTANALADAGAAAGLIAPPPEDPNARFLLDLTAPGRFVDDAVPLGVIYLLEIDRSGHVQSRPASPSDAVVALAANTYAHSIGDRHEWIRELDDLTSIVRSVPVRHLARSHDLTSLWACRDLVLNDSSSMIDG